MISISPQTPDSLQQIGEALFGRQWQTDLSRALNLSDARRIRQFMKEERAIPKSLWTDLLELIQQQQRRLHQLPCLTVTGPVAEPAHEQVAHLQQMLGQYARSTLETDPVGYYAKKGVEAELEQAIQIFQRMDKKGLLDDPRNPRYVERTLSQLNTLQTHEW